MDFAPEPKRRVSFSSNRIVFPTEKYTRQLNAAEASEPDLSQIDILAEQKYDDLKLHHAELQSQYNALKMKQRFMQYISKMDEGTLPFDEEDNLVETVRELKRERERAEQSNKEAIKTINNEILRTIDNHQQARIVRNQIQSDLQEVKKKMSDMIATPPQKQAPKVHQQTVPLHPVGYNYSHINNLLVGLSGVEVLISSMGNVVLSLSIHHPEEIKEFTLTLLYDENSKLQDYQLDPPFPIAPQIVSSAKSTNNTLFLVSSVLEALQQCDPSQHDHEMSL